MLLVNVHEPFMEVLADPTLHYEGHHSSVPSKNKSLLRRNLFYDVTTLFWLWLQ